MANAVRTDDVRRQNTRLLMGSLRRLQRAARTELVDYTGLSPATVSSITSDLLAQAILLSSEDSATQHRRGRPRITLYPNPDMGYIVVIALAMNSIYISLENYAGQVLRREKHFFPSRQASLEEFLDTLIGLIKEVLSTTGSTGTKTSQQQSPSLRYISVAVQGTVIENGQVWLSSPMMPHRHVPLGRILSEHFSVPVMLCNDCNRAAEALHWLYPEQFGENFATISLTQGIGMGLVLHGQTFVGVSSSAGEFGHMCYQPGGARCRCGQLGCIEAYAGDYAIYRRAMNLPLDTDPAEEMPSQHLLAILENAHLRQGSERQAFREAGRAIGGGLQSLFALTDSLTVAFMGPGVIGFDLMKPEIEAALQSNTANPQPPIEMYCYKSADELIRVGCSLSALQALDNRINSSDSLS
ncbi:MAG: hypothetical protein CR991_01735 [Proteobacteria bacterium]|nr:MAG: hypothetical protein CR991_01735 [Pseudomonadota bacterium]